MAQEESPHSDTSHTDRRSSSASSPSPPPAPSDIVQSYIARGFKVVFWSGKGEAKGPFEKNWLEKAVAGAYTLDRYHDGDRVGILHGVELAPGRWIIDVDIDYGPLTRVAVAMLPATRFVWGRASKEVSHCLYLAPDTTEMKQYKDIGKDGVVLIEFRSDRHQSMAPPSVWEKDGKREPLQFRAADNPTVVDSAEFLKYRVCLAATAMLLAKHFGYNGFGHDARLAWAGFLARLGVSREDLRTMGLAISEACNNTELHDVDTVLESTFANLQRPNKKVKGARGLAEILGADGELVLARIREWFGKTDDFVRDRKGHVLAKHQENIKLAITKLKHELSFNEFSATMLIDNQRLEDPQWKGLYLEIDRQFQMQPPVDYFKMVVETMATSNNFHPVKQYLDALTWDQTPRIDTWLITSAKAEDTPYVRAISAIMLIAAVRRIREPGCKYDEMVVWESPQGAEKSSAARALCPYDDWFSDDLRLNLHAQQLIEATLGKWIVEASDLAGKRKTEIEQLKAMLSRQRDGPARMAYAHYSVERPRHFILIGTTNSAAYLNDQTGSRRFWPMSVKRFNLSWIKTHRDQLWAEACVREAKGESIRLKEELWPYATEEQEKRREIDPWEDILLKKVLATPIGKGHHIRLSTNAIWDELKIVPERRDRYGANRISEIMQRLGFKRTRVYENGEVQVGYIDADETTLTKLKEWLEAEKRKDEENREIGEDDAEGEMLNSVKHKTEDDPPF